MAGAQDRAAVSIEYVRVTDGQGPLAELAGRITGLAVSGQIAKPGGGECQPLAAQLLAQPAIRMAAEVGKHPLFQVFLWAGLASPVILCCARTHARA